MHEKVQDTPEIIGENTEVHSPYYHGALDLLNAELQNHPSSEKNQETAKDILDNIDQQGIENFSVFKSKEFPGVNLPYVKISLETLIDEIAPTLEQEEPTEKNDLSNEKAIYVISSGFAYPPAGHPFTPWDIAYDRVMDLLPKAIKARKKGQPIPDLYVLGSPNSLWGKVTPEWIEKLKTEGFSAYGKLCAELLGPIFDQEKHHDTAPRVVLHGMSLGTAVVAETRKQLPTDIQDRTQLLLDNPVLSNNILQVPIGFLLESVLRLVFDPKIKKSMSHEPEFYKQSERALRTLGIEPADSLEDVSLKKQAAMVDVKNLMKTKTFAEGNKTYIRLGLFDPVSFSLVRILERLRKYKRYTTHGLAATDNIYPINTSHFIDRYRVKKWAKNIIGLDL
ncbi:MAG: hypothetical protein COU63_00430 [Candidatus Pacebacteria bacterium CG10_big_fil_rev_8_21_14_0_10_36_11]|nr:hypothetical protein [Candidatus Pacearchaeota archaeon]OIP74498.1 MAG: hypothetical protein AUK08_00025 [Candidatus Pacebacteria bacterium CG2_30_36_39]PIR65123.1 MAG: hypothetical protein COU63_00430 [Candidatus Pacebacteria bacterium CG10_big_fil_rev_8_21_14_0_10_36_11]PJC42678.1 MAG: hypothetical protein CO040_03320 [Candidatus Pacebacteria bacterium CG_4_9_14_0_2_um_filter_36_8]